MGLFGVKDAKERPEWDSRFAVTSVSRSNAHLHSSLKEFFDQPRIFRTDCSIAKEIPENLLLAASVEAEGHPGYASRFSLSRAPNSATSMFSLAGPKPLAPRTRTPSGRSPQIPLRHEVQHQCGWDLQHRSNAPRTKKYIGNAKRRRFVRVPKALAGTHEMYRPSSAPPGRPSWMPRHHVVDYSLEPVAPEYLDFQSSRTVTAPFPVATTHEQRWLEAYHRKLSKQNRSQSHNEHAAGVPEEPLPHWL